MSWMTSLNPFKKKTATAGPNPAPDSASSAGIPSLPAELAGDPQAQGALGSFFRKWKNPAFLKQMRTLAAHMQRDGIDVKNIKAAQAWIEKNKDRIEKGEFNDLPATKPGETYVKTGPEIGRNEPCHCGSGKKFKKCHGR